MKFFDARQVNRRIGQRKGRWMRVNESLIDISIENKPFSVSSFSSVYRNKWWYKMLSKYDAFGNARIRSTEDKWERSAASRRHVRRCCISEWPFFCLASAFESVEEVPKEEDEEGRWRRVNVRARARSTVVTSFRRAQHGPPLAALAS